MPSLVTPAILLRAIAYGESDRIVTLLGRSTGRVSALARGARRSQRRFAGLGLGVVGEASLRERTGAELLSLERLDVRELHPGFATDVARMAHASYVLELLLRLCAPRQAEPAVYDWAEETLTMIDQHGASAERLRVFELGLLARLGFAPSIEVCVKCGRNDLGGEVARWNAVAGGTLCGRCGGSGRILLPHIREALAGLAKTPLRETSALALQRDVNAACREAILEVIRTHVSGPLRSVEFIGKLGGGT